MRTRSGTKTAASEIALLVAGVEDSIRRHARESIAKPWSRLSMRDVFTAVALSTRDRLIERMLVVEEQRSQQDRKSVHYISIEYLPGQSLGNHLRNLGVRELYRDALSNLGLDLEQIEEVEMDAALGNGGLGRLAACFLDSMATLGIAGYGYGINYEYGLFKQEIEDGYQREKPENWLAQGCPWEIVHDEDACMVPLYGRIEHGVDRSGGYNPMWMDWKVLIGVPCDMLISGYGGKTVNRLRLFSARSSHDFDIRIFNEGDYFKAVEQKIASETVSKVLYPSDAMTAGRELRLVQEYFLVACSMRDIVRSFEREHNDFRTFPARIAVQLNDTHPALAVAELMRILIDEKSLSWDEALAITQATLGYTNHTLAAEALEKWPVELLERVLPRHLQIIYEINRRFLEKVAAVSPGDQDRLRRMSIFEESSSKQVRMDHLAVVGCHSVNGVSAIHTGLLARFLHEFHELWPERFHNVTNGVTPRRWMLQANPGLANLIAAELGTEWITDLLRLRGLESRASDAGFQEDFRRVKRSNKERLERIIRGASGIAVDPASLFDVQTKRIHLYKRQLLNLLHIIADYLSLIEDGFAPAVPRTYIFSGKAAPGFWAAKQIIKLIHDLGHTINSDGRAQPWMKVVFLPDYSVSLAEKIVPAADLSEQISTAGTEASGTGNMKFALNGALTIGTLDGANLEIRDEVGAGNAFMFGLTAEEIHTMQKSGLYRPHELYAADARVKRIVDGFSPNLFLSSDPYLLRWVKETLLAPQDEYFHLADLTAYLEAHAKAGSAFRDEKSWACMSILNVARMGKFSSDRAVAEYARDIWGIPLDQHVDLRESA